MNLDFSKNLCFEMNLDDQKDPDLVKNWDYSKTHYLVTKWDWSNEQSYDCQKVRQKKTHLGMHSVC